MAEEFTDFIRYFGASVELTCFHQRAVTCVKFGVQSSKEKYIQASENPNYLTEVAELKVQWIFKGSEGDPQSCYYSFVFQNIEYAFSCFLQNEVSIDSTHTININPSNPCEHSWTLRCDTYPTRFIGSYHISQKKMYEAIGDGDKWLIEKLSEVASNLSHPQWKGQFQGLDLADKALGHPLQINKLVERAESEQNIAEDKRRAKILQEEIDEIRFRESEDPCRVEIVSRSKGTSQSIGEYKVDILKKR